MPRRVIDMTGKTIGHLTVIGRDGSRWETSGNKAAWRCRCVCGEQRTVAGADLRRGHTKSCGCGGQQPKLELEDWTPEELAVAQSLRALNPPTPFPQIGAILKRSETAVRLKLYDERTKEERRISEAKSERQRIGQLSTASANFEKQGDAEQLAEVD